MRLPAILLPFLLAIATIAASQEEFPDTSTSHWAYEVSSHQGAAKDESPADQFVRVSKVSPRRRILLDADWRFYIGEPDGSGFVTRGVPITTWRWEEAPATPQPPAFIKSFDTSGSNWHDSKTGEDTFKGRVGFSWYQTTLPTDALKLKSVHFEGVDDNATVYLNGKNLAHHEGWNDFFDVDLTSAISKTGPNVLTVLVENTNGPGGITAPVSLTQPAPVATEGPAKPAYNDKAWRTVHLPHDYVVEGKFDSTADGSHGFLPKVTGWYRKTFTVSTRDKGLCAWIDFDGVYRNSKVWLNGHFLGTHPSGYTSFRYNIAPYLHYGAKNILAVHVDPRQNEGWWYEGGGIYRHVWLNFADPVHIQPWGVFISSSLREPLAGHGAGPATVTIQTELENEESRSANLRVLSIVMRNGDAEAVIETATTVKTAGIKSLIQTVIVPEPHLWSLEKPTCYEVYTFVKQAGSDRVLDVAATTFGIRTIRYDAATGFYLNGKHVKIQGTCNHQDYAGLGIAVPDNLEYWRVAKLKEMGANAWRMSHNPPTPALLEACDKLGMLVMDENRHLGDSPAVLGEVKDMVLRDRNHPSIVMWSMCNEEGAAGSERGGHIFAAMKAATLSLDTTRPISCAMNSGWFGNGFTYVEDLMGVNYNYEVYDRFHNEHPAMPMFGSETASTVTTRGEYADNAPKTYVSSYNMTDGSWEPAGTRPFIAGTFVWTGFDYKGEPSPYGWPCINSHFGIMDMCGFPKDNYYYYQSWWKTRPIVHLMPHWNWRGKEGQAIKVVAFSNADKVELFLNGQSLGAKQMPRWEHLEWTVPYQPGALSARAYDSNGKTIATDKVSTTGAPAKLKLTASTQPLRANGEDVTVVEVAVLDAQGRLVPTASNDINFSITGPAEIAGVGNGNPSDHDPDHATHRHAFNGRCVVIVRAKNRAGKFHLTARSAGLLYSSVIGAVR